MNSPAGMESMPFGKAISSGFRKHADFNGRASRPEFWWFLLFVTLVGSALSALDFSTPDGVIAIGSSLTRFWIIATLVPTLAVAARRLRDADGSPSELYWLLVPIAGLIMVGIRLSAPSAPNVLGPADAAPAVARGHQAETPQDRWIA